MEEGRKIIAVDMDGVLCSGAWFGFEKETPTPIEQNIEIINSLYHKRHIIIIHTARPERVRSETEKWLDDNRVLYHSMVMGKLSADVYLDDHAVNVKDIDTIV